MSNKRYTKGEEIANASSHGLGILLGIIVGVFLMRGAFETNNRWIMVSFAIYLLGMLSSYITSTWYHACNNEHRKALLRKFDHGAIYLHIAGTYTPFTLVVLRDYSELWKQFEYILLEAIGNTMIVEAIPVDSLGKKEKALFSLFIGDEWQMLNKVTLCRRKKKFEELICKLGLSTIKEELTELIKAECYNLRDLESENCNRINVFTTASTSLKVKDTNKSLNKDLDKNATESTFFENTSKYEKCNQINIKIKGDLIAGCTMKTTVPPDSINPIPEYTNKIKHEQIRVQNRGKPKDGPIINDTG